jgi:DNA-binding IclR family transcriptional regulator
MYGVGVRVVPEPPAPQLNPRERQVLEFVGRGAGLDEVGRETGLTAASVRVTLARLERRGLIRRASSGSYVPAA